jgi:hypothetical protein
MRTKREVQPEPIQTEYKEVMESLWGSKEMCPFHSFVCMINAAFFWEGGKFSIQYVLEKWWCFAFEDKAPYPDEGLTLRKVVCLVMLKLFYDACRSEGHGLSSEFQEIVDNAEQGDFSKEVPEIHPVMRVYKGNQNQTVHMDKETLMATAKKVTQDREKASKAKEAAVDYSFTPKSEDKEGDFICNLLWERKYTDEEISTKASNKFGEDAGKRIKECRKWMNKHGEKWFKGITKNPVEKILPEGEEPDHPPIANGNPPKSRSARTPAAPPAAEPHRMARKPRA